MGQVRAELCRKAEIEVAAVCDLDPRLANLFPGVPFYRNYNGLLTARLGLDAVFVCVFNNAVAEIVSFSLFAGMHVFCEKPPGRNLQDVNLIKQTEALCPDRILMFGFDHRYQPHVLCARKELKAGSLGKILWIRGVYGTRGHSSTWRQIEMLSGGGIGLDLGVHMVDLLRWLTGDEFTVVSSLIDYTQTEALVDDNVFALLRSTQGIHASIHLSAMMEPAFHIEIGMTEGFVRIAGLSTLSGRYLPAACVAYPTNPSINVRLISESGLIGQSFRTEIEIFRRAVAGKPFEDYHISSCTASSDDAWEAMALIEAIYAKDADANENIGRSA